jgi:xanthine dehydrogenase accessory factor
MMSGAIARRAEALSTRGEGFVTATVVRVQHPASVSPGEVALVLGDGTIEGFVGGVCTQHSVRLYALRALERGEPLLLRVMPDGPEAEDDATDEDGAVTVRNPCLSGGSVELFLEPVLPSPRVLVGGQTPTAQALFRLGPELGLDMLAVEGAVAPAAGDLALVVAAHGGDEELSAVRAGLEAELPYVGLVASRKRGAALVEELRGEGVADDRLARLDMPAGLPIGARTPGEIAVAILARVIEVRRGETWTPPASGGGAVATAVDPICGMTVVPTDDTPRATYDGETVVFCCEGCRATFEAEHAGSTS